MSWCIVLNPIHTFIISIKVYNKPLFKIFQNMYVILWFFIKSVSIFKSGKHFKNFSVFEFYNQYCGNRSYYHNCLQPI